MSFRIERFYVELRTTTKLTVFRRGHARELFEGCAEMGLTRKTGRQSDLRKRKMSGIDLTTSKLNPELSYICSNAGVIVVAKCGSEMNWVHADETC